LTSKPNLYDLIEENKLLKIELEKLKEQPQPIIEQLVKNTSQINQINQLKANIQKERIATKNLMLKCKALDNKIFQIKKLIDKIICKDN
jgi:regulator of replication initiation timing